MNCIPVLPPSGVPRAGGARRAAGGCRRGVLAAGLCALILAGCGGRPQGGAGPAIGPREGPGHPQVGTLAPEFAAQDPSGPWLPLRSLQDKPVALLFFRPGAPSAVDLARAFGDDRERGTYEPVVFLGLAQDSLARIKEFARIQRISLPLMRDPGTIARSYVIGELPTVVLLDSDHVIRFRLDGYLGAGLKPRLGATREALAALPNAVREAGRPLDLAYAEHPRAPVFSARALDGRRVDLAALRGRPVVLNFFDQECPHCLKDLPALVPVVRGLRSRGVAAIGVVSRNLGGTLARFLKEQGIDYPVVVDPDRALFKKYESTRTPDTFLIDRDGFIRFREPGDRPDRAELTRLQLRLLLGETPAALAAALPKGRYAGDAACRACHAREYDDWLFTPHSIAWDSLEAGDKWRDPECVPCHVTGQGRPGGFADKESTPHLVNVQCEVCHGPGGGHPDGRGLDLEAMRTTCLSCHTGKFVLNFDLDEALALVAHRDHPDLERLFKYSDLQRQRLERINTRRLEKFKSGVAYVGADACRDCHLKEHEQWSRTAHAAAFARLVQARRAADRTCLPCHTTGMGQRGGFGESTSPDAPPMTGVQCEVCHGPGDDHVKAPPDLKAQTIYGITDQCSFCIIQGVCATCHDQKNDPGFNIEHDLPLVTHDVPRGRP